MQETAHTGHVELLFVLLLVAAGLIAMVWLGGRRTRSDPPSSPADGLSRPATAEDRLSQPGTPEDRSFDPADLAELSAAMTAIATEHRERHEQFTESGLRLRLQRVINRRSPVRRITAAPIRGATRICFADGTGILVRCQQGGLALLAYYAGRQPVCLRSCRLGPEGPELTFDYQGGQFTAVVVGFDQAD